MENRRKFLKTAGAVAAGTVIVPFGCTPKKAKETTEAAAVAEKAVKDVGIQIYTLRKEIESLGIEAAMQKVADIGYKFIEPFGYENRKFFGKTPEEFRKMIEGMGMSMPSVHSVTEVSSGGGKDAIISQMKTTAEDALNIGAEYLVWAYLKEEERTSIDDYKRHIETWNQFGEICKEAGIQFAYHNHDFEFIDFDGQKPYDLILQETDPDNVKMELDLYWITKAGESAVEYFKKAPGRFPLWHVKDMHADDKFFAPVGDGVVEFDKIFNAREKAGNQYIFVEQDDTREGEEIYTSIEKSWKFLQNADYVK